MVFQLLQLLLESMRAPRVSASLMILRLREGGNLRIHTAGTANHITVTLPHNTLQRFVLLAERREQQIRCLLSKIFFFGPSSVSLIRTILRFAYSRF